MHHPCWIAFAACAAWIGACGGSNAGQSSRASDSGAADGNTATADNPRDAAAEEGHVGSWVPYSEGLMGASIVDVLFDTRTESTVYATGGNTVYQSTDSGSTWRVRGTFAGGTIGKLAMVGNDQHNLLATSTSGVIASADAGLTWNQLSLDGIAVTSIATAAMQPLLAYAGVRGSGVFRSDDGGRTWSARTNGYPYMDTLAISIDPSDPEIVVAGGILLNANDGYSSDGVVIRTTDGGQNWQTVVQGRGDVWNIRRCMADPSVVYAAANMGVVRSADYGKTWSLLPIGDVVEDVAIAPGACGDVYAMASGSGPRHSTDGGLTFGPPLVNGIRLNPIGGKMAVDLQNAGGIVLGSHGGIWVTANGGAQWNAAAGLLDMIIRGLSTSPIDPARLWLASWGSGVWERPSPSQPWERVSNVPADYAFAATPHPYAANRVFVGAGGLYQSNNGTAFVQDTLSENEFAFAFDPTSANTLYAATQLNGVYKSTDGGATWVPSSTGLAPWNEQLGIPVIDVESIVVDPAAPQSLYIGTNGSGVYKSTDGAQSWKSILAPGQVVGCLLVVRGTQTSVYAAIRGGGVQSSIDGGGTWTDVSDGLPTLDVNGLVTDSTSGTLCATTNKGVFIKQGTRPWTGFDLGSIPGAAVSSPAIVVDGGRRLLVVAAGGGVYAHAL